ncbi:MAG: exodeoxyribonuclease III [Gammaproteobacteria bacterium]
MLKIATWNVNSLRMRLSQVLQWLTIEQPDVFALQETKITDDQFPLEAIEAAGYCAHFSGQPSYNGVATLTKRPASRIATELPGYLDPERRVLVQYYGDLVIANFYVPNGVAIGSDKYRYKLEWLDALRAYVGQLLAENSLLVALGDFNIAPEDRDVHDPELWRDKVLVSEPERQALQQLLAQGLSDSFRLFDQVPASFSWWDYRAGAFRRNHGLRIDLILISSALAKGCTACSIDKKTRKRVKPSDHAPVVATFEL